MTNEKFDALIEIVSEAVKKVAGDIVCENYPTGDIQEVVRALQTLLEAKNLYGM